MPRSRVNRREPAVSRVLSGTIIHLGQLSPAASSNLPGNPLRRAERAAWTRAFPYLVLLQAGFTLPRRVTTRAVRSYRTISPLPVRRPAVYFLWHFPWARALQALPGALPDEARTFLDDALALPRLPCRLSPSGARMIPQCAPG